MAGERMFPILPCRDIDEAIAFYAALGFRKTYRQLRPNPYAVVARDDMQVHLFGMDNFDPSESYGSVIIQVSDPDELYRSFVEGLRGVYKKIPNAGIPRILRPRKKFGTVYGFSVVDVGGNWLRISKLGETDKSPEENEASPAAKDLGHFIDLAARLGDAHGDDTKAIQTLESGLRKHADAPALLRARGLLYHVDLAMRLDRKDVARASLVAVNALKLSTEERKSLVEEWEHATSIVSEETTHS
jgi:catechol 2,3-dioxygenase-like lactoylglutathione lyase family enzyme